MKKKHLNAKLSLKKKNIAPLQAGGEALAGGAKGGTVTICQYYSCTGEATCGIACTVIDCLKTQHNCDTVLNCNTNTCPTWPPNCSQLQPCIG
ncbi:class I lanthipeptide [Taibaiella koreensis]|uniref:class I lanthipeptide n=1 Tax=Taibaiella koreensis TaxID=1268548 RepID=UPI000E59B9AE|nr:class I lanthipeptide [Taibaiella koreensis]